MSLVEAPLHGGQRRLGVDQPDFDLFIDRVGDLALVRAAGFSRPAGRFRRLGLELRDLLSCGFHIRMVFGVLQQQTIEVTADLLQSLVDRRQSAIDDDLRPAFDAQRRRDRSQFLLQRVPLRQGVRQFDFQAVDDGARLVDPAEATVSVYSRVRGPVGNDVRVFLRQVGSPFLGGPQLVSIRIDLALQETLCIVHVGSAASRRLLGEDRQQRLNDVLRRVGILVAIRQVQQIQRYRCDRDIARQPLIEGLFLLGVCNSDVQIR